MKKKEKNDVTSENMGEQELEKVIGAITGGTANGGYDNCNIQLDGIGIIANKGNPNMMIMRLGTFSLELHDTETTLLDKVQYLAELLRLIKELGWRPDKMVIEPNDEATEGMFN